MACDANQILASKKTYKRREGEKKWVWMAQTMTANVKLIGACNHVTCFQAQNKQ